MNRQSPTQKITRRRAVGMRRQWVRFGGARGGGDGGLDLVWPWALAGGLLDAWCVAWEVDQGESRFSGHDRSPR